MNKLETDKFSRASTEREMIEDYDGPLEYCDGCFIALGSQEKRIYKGRKKFHMHCVARGKVQAKMMEKAMEMELLLICFRGVNPCVDC